jgi:hypothetical protein
VSDRTGSRARQSKHIKTHKCTASAAYSEKTINYSAYQARFQCSSTAPGLKKHLITQAKKQPVRAVQPSLATIIQGSRINAQNPVVSARERPARHAGCSNRGHLPKAQAVSRMQNKQLCQYFQVASHLVIYSSLAKTSNLQRCLFDCIAALLCKENINIRL